MTDASGEINVELGRTVRRHIEHKTSPLENRALVAEPYGSPHNDRIPVFVSESAMKAMERHAAGQIDREVGGVLLGGFYRSDKASYIEVTGVIEAHAAEASDVSLTFTHETWEQINAEHARREPEAQIVGWYHSHPGLGVFMSKEDEFIHANYFADPWHVAMVVDPIYHNWGCFKSTDGALGRTEGFYIFAEKKAARRVKEFTKNLVESRQRTPRSAGSNADPGPSASSLGLWAAFAMLLLLQGVLFAIIVADRRARSVELDYYKQAEEMLAVSNVTGALDCLRTGLSSSPTREALILQVQLERLLGNPKIKELDNAAMDAQNAKLAAADAVVAKAYHDYEHRPLWTRLLEEAGLRKPRYAPADAARYARGVYRDAAPTREVRLRRAQDLKKIENGNDARLNGAVEWLTSERSAEIAYGALAPGEDGSNAGARETKKNGAVAAI
ncbi:MAG: Mov34/MPN/PAD-1 family protein, partial [Armatimonadota bacterium]